MNPKRIKRERKKGWRKPENTVNVARPSKWGNPYNWQDEEADLATRVNYATLSSPVGRQLMQEEAKKIASQKFKRALLKGELSFSIEDVKRELKGKNLMCWCRESEFCHGDYLIQVANME